MAMVEQVKKMVLEVQALVHEPDSTGGVCKSLQRQLLARYWRSRVRWRPGYSVAGGNDGV
jgi:hypothetical protein